MTHFLDTLQTNFRYHEEGYYFGIQVNGADLREATHDQAVEVIRNASDPVHFSVQSLHSFPPLEAKSATASPASSNPGTPSTARAQPAPAPPPGTQPEPSPPPAEEVEREPSPPPPAREPSPEPEKEVVQLPAHTPSPALEDQPMGAPFFLPHLPTYAS